MVGVIDAMGSMQDGLLVAGAQKLDDSVAVGVHVGF